MAVCGRTATGPGGDVGNKSIGDADMSDLPKRTCEISTDLTTGEAQTVITVENSPPIVALAWLNFLKQRLAVLQFDFKHITADRIVVPSRSHPAESVARLVQSAVKCADDYVSSSHGIAHNR